jgi:aconitate decarboxylase
VLLAFGKPFRFVDPGMALKFFPSKYPTHFGIAAALGLRSAVTNPDDIVHVHIDAPDIADADRPQPRSGLEGKFSFQYTVAAALLDAHVGIETFNDERRFRADMTRLIPKIALERDASRSRDTRNMHVAVSVTLRDGTTHKQICTRPPGSWGEPVDPAMHRAKLRSCLGVGLPEGSVERAIDLLGSLEQLAPHEVQQLLTLLRQ